jgi:hypothetical protein
LSAYMVEPWPRALKKTARHCALHERSEQHGGGGVELVIVAGEAAR